ncbi:leukotriene B4 receptor 1-like [Scleropages formosus]|uniref:Leukotriene B4 receptor 2a n=1 Tax=Scleropages formosus TaxID=113540 RepID=A0A8C9RW10_SCLFO|nr:leukotriene B4 receptor 1-like [Scleropages formosus]
MAQTQTPLNSSSSLLHALSSPPSNLNKTACENIICHNASTIIASLILGLVFLLGCPGNLFVIWSILARARKRSITTLLILHLACADGFLMTLTPFFVIYLAKKTWMFGNIMCKGIFYLCCVNMFASVLLIMLMSVYRMLAVVCPQRVGTLATRKAFLRLLVGVWLLVLIMSSPILAFREEKEENVTEHIRTICIPNANTLESLVMIHYSIETFFGFVLPYGVIVSCYVCILRRIRQTKFRRRIRSEKLILAIVVTFGLFWLPYQVINVMQVIAGLCPEESPLKKRLTYMWQSSRTITSTLAFVSSCANPVLYSLAGKAYIRQAGLGFMARLFEGTDSNTRKGRQMSQNSKPKEEEGVDLSNKEAESSVTVSAVKIQR